MHCTEPTVGLPSPGQSQTRIQTLHVFDLLLHAKHANLNAIIQVFFVVAHITPHQERRNTFSVAVRVLLPNLQPHSYTLLHIRRLIGKQYNQVKSERKRKKKGTAAKSWSRPESSRGRQGNCMPCQRVGPTRSSAVPRRTEAAGVNPGPFQVSPLSGLQTKVRPHSAGM